MKGKTRTDEYISSRIVIKPELWRGNYFKRRIFAGFSSQEIAKPQSSQRTSHQISCQIKNLRDKA